MMSMEMIICLLDDQSTSEKLLSSFSSWPLQWLFKIIDHERRASFFILKIHWVHMVSVKNRVAYSLNLELLLGHAQHSLACFSWKCKDY